MTIEITPEVIEGIKTYFADPGLNMEELENGSLPTIATVRELEVDGGPNRIEARYSGANYEVNLTNFGGLEQVLLRLHNGSLSMAQNGVPTGEHKTPLSLKNREYCYVIFKLKSKNWQFSGDKPPFSIGIDWWKKGWYFNARKVYNGIDQGHLAQKNGCMIAYFIADGAAALDDAPNGKYSHGFNFHLDLIYEDSDHQPSYMPIIIDPDIRYPGGSGEP